MATAVDVEAALARCCGSDAWVRAVGAAVVAARADGHGGAPDAVVPAVVHASEQAFAALPDDEWRAAFAAHPAAIPVSADAGTLDAVRVALRLYEEQFGHAFVSSAAIATADELLMRVRIRLGNDPADEWRQACDEQRRATRQRLDTLLHGME